MTNKDDLIDRMVDKFLSMPMPKNFSPDGGIKFDREINGRYREFKDPYWPVGTNLFDAEQAREMFKILLAGIDMKLASERPVEVPKTPFVTDLDTVINELREILINKNRKYGDSALNPKRIFSKASAVEQINVRLDDKISRLMSGQMDDTEDVELDLVGYIILKRIAKLREEK